MSDEIPPISNAANLLLMQHSIYTMTKDPSAITALQKTLENILPDLLFRPSDEDVLRFYDFDNVFEHGDAEKMIVALKSTYPSIMKLNPALIVELHDALRRTDYGGKLSYRDLVAFLIFSHHRAMAGWTPERLEEVVKKTIHDMDMFNEIQPITTSKTLSKLVDGKADLTTFLSGFRVLVGELIQYMKAQHQAIREQHGPIETHESIEDLMTKIGNCVDKTALQMLVKQVLAIHAAQLTTENAGGITYAEKLAALIDEALAVSN